MHRLIPLLLLLAAALISCSESQDRVTVSEVSTPPSVQGEQDAESRFVTLSEQQSSDLSIETTVVERKNTEFPVIVSGSVAAAPEHVAFISTPVSGRITKIFAHEGEEVKKGEPLLEMESLEYAELAANYMEARAEKSYLEQQVNRLSSLVEQRISPQSSLDRAQADLSRADARIRASRARLQAIGIDDETISSWSRDSESEKAILTMYATIDGKINQHLIDLGQAVNANDMLMDLVNNEQVLVRGFVDPDDIPFLKPGAKAVVSQRMNRQDGAGSHSLETEITTIQPGLDQENRSIVVNSHLKTENQWPVIGQSVRIEYTATTPGDAISVPMSAVQYEGQHATVFVKVSDLQYEIRSVSIERILQESAIVSSGLEDGEEVAVSQVFSLKALGKFEEFAED
ncbi:MAG: efflux RND transporter periplasmic adaptor subunit [Balneolaceae bacterium]